MAIQDVETIRGLLEGLRTDLTRVSQQSLMKSSSWSAHANWKSSGALLPGDFALSSSMRQPIERAAELEKIAQDLQSERFL